MFDPHAPFAGTLYAFVAFDWGAEVDLAHARRLVPAELQTLTRRPRTPSSFAFRPSPLRIPLADAEIELQELGAVRATCEATVFDIGAVSVALRVPLELPADRLLRLADGLTPVDAIVTAARSVLSPLFDKLRPAVSRPCWSDLSEEYIVFHLPPHDGATAAELLTHASPWLAGLVRLEKDPLSEGGIAEALKQHISYGPADLFVAEWSAAALFDRDCEETLQTVEFANLKLLEFRHLDQTLDDRLATAYRDIQRLTRKWLPFSRSHGRTLWALGELKMEANDVCERTVNVLKLVGDQYLARVYRMLSARFHLEEWQQSVRQSLDVLEGVYRAVSDQAATLRTELLEWIIILLIFSEIVLTFLRH